MRPETRPFNAFEISDHTGIAGQKRLVLSYVEAHPDRCFSHRVFARAGVGDQEFRTSRLNHLR